MNQSPVIIGKINIVDKPSRHSYAVCDGCNRKFFGCSIDTLYSNGNRQLCVPCIEDEEMEYWESFGPDECEHTIFD